ncbi:hypothetical protein GGH99_003440 [Coemansia sp. RSA 1285]|nr:hypothetical protein EV177_001559 [Coemansia sp. RSA 1804]KAJ2686628.1 hypothetical protein GGH99_003440 [Coemansia sp. RSA 1285]
MGKEFVDLYELLEVSSKAGEKELTRAYRAKALKYHPDKNRDNPEVAQIFHDIKTAYDTLADAKKRAEHDEQRRALIAKRQRQSMLTGNRKKMKSELEADERRAHEAYEAQKMMRAQSTHDAEAARFREEAQREEWRRGKSMREHTQRQQQKKMEADDEREREERRRQASAALEDVDELDRSIRIRWDPADDDVSQEMLATAFAPFGEIEEVVVAPVSGHGRRRAAQAKQQSALIVFKSVVAAHALMNVQHETPRIRRFERYWAGGREPEAVQRITGIAAAKKESVVSQSAPIGGSVCDDADAPSAQRQKVRRPDISELDLDSVPGIELDFAEFEALTLMRMRQHHQKQRAAPT